MIDSKRLWGPGNFREWNRFESVMKMQLILGLSERARAGTGRDCDKLPLMCPTGPAVTLHEPIVAIQQ